MLTCSWGENGEHLSGNLEENARQMGKKLQRSWTAKILKSWMTRIPFISRPFISWMFVFTVYGSQSSINHHTYPIRFFSIFISRPDGLSQCLHVKQTSLFQVLVNPFKLHQKWTFSVMINSQDPHGNPRWKLMVNGKRSCLHRRAESGQKETFMKFCFNFRPLGFDPLNSRITRKVSSSRPLFSRSMWLPDALPEFTLGATRKGQRHKLELHSS